MTTPTPRSTQKKPRPPADEGEGFDPDFIREISMAVYAERLTAQCGPSALKHLLASENDPVPGYEVHDVRAAKMVRLTENRKGIAFDRTKLRDRAVAYDVLTRAYLVALGIKPPRG